MILKYPIGFKERIDDLFDFFRKGGRSVFHIDVS